MTPRGPVAGSAAVTPAECARHQDALLDFVDHGEAGPPVAAALRHLERCSECERDLAATALVLTALRRMFDEVRNAESPPDVWPRLRARVAPRRRPWVPGTITGLVTGAALVTALLLPVAGRLGASEYAGEYLGDVGSGPEMSLEIPDAAWMSAFPAASPSSSIDHSSAGRLPPVPRPTIDRGDDPVLVEFAGSAPNRYPDNLRPTSAGQRPIDTALVPSRVVRRL